MFREVKRTIAALDRPGAGAASAPRRDDGAPISRVRAVVQIVLTVLLVPLCVWALFGNSDAGEASRNAASALLGAIVTFWLKD